MSVFRESPYSSLSFGDVCSGFPWFDASLRADATALQVQQAPQKFAQRYGVERIDFFVPADGDAVPLPKTSDYVLAHGAQLEEAACISDDCVIETALGRDSRGPSGHLLFAPVLELQDGEAEELQGSLRRHPLGQNRVIELGRTFRVKAVDISESINELERTSLTETARSDLATRWAAHACRTGPLVALDNADKLARLLMHDGLDEAKASEVAQSLVDVSALGWLFESKGLESAGEEYDEHRERIEDARIAVVVEGVRNSLEQLRERADYALSLLP